MGLLLLLASFIWGTTFVAQSAGLRHVGPFTFIAVRSLIASAGLFLCARLLKKRGIGGAAKGDGTFKSLLRAGLACGLVLFCSTMCQQMGLLTTTAGKAGFITSLYIIIVPVMGLFIRRPVRPMIWCCVFIAAIGLYRMTVREGFSIDRGDLMVLLCAVFFSVHIYVVDHFSAQVDAISLCGMQFFVCGIVATPLMFLLERPSLLAIRIAAFPILYAALLSGGVAYTIQIVCQRHVEPAKASLMMCMESAFALLAGWVVLGERMTPRELSGCAIMFFAILLSVLPEPNWRRLCRGTKLQERLH